MDCAYLIAETEMEEKVKKIVATLNSISAETLKAKGKAGLDEIVAHYSNDSVTEQYVNLANKLSANG